MKFKITLFISVIVFTISLNSVAQTQTTNQSFIPTIYPKSPTTAALDKYGDYPVNLYSGLPEISIPIYTVDAGGVKFPITLSYHASGIKVDESSSWVGLGWSISAGGRITRSVVGNPDENNYFVSNSPVAGYRNVNNLHPTSVDADVDYLKHLTANDGGYDSRPDIFSYDFPGHSGKFFYNGNDGYKLVMVPFSPINIQNTATPFATSAPKFMLRDEIGNVYQMGFTQTEITHTANASNATPAITSWMLENMVTQNKRDTVSFTYQEQLITPPDHTGQTIIVEDSETYPMGSPNAPHPYASSPTTLLSATSSTVNEKDIKRINFKNGFVDFVLSPYQRTDIGGAAYPLDSINVYNYDPSIKQYQLLKSVVFSKSYFGSSTNQRLRLDSVLILDKNKTTVERYKFSYNPLQIPGYETYSKDYWGYYNGKMDNSSSPSLIPQTTVTLQGSGTTGTATTIIGSSDPYSRDPDSTKMQAYMLQRIDYPTGGHTDFTFQTNRYYDGSSIMHLTGGLRVLQITSYDNSGYNNPIIKTYRYDQGFPNFITDASHGFLNFSFFIHQETVRYFANPLGGCYNVHASKRSRAYFAEPSLNLNATEGNPVAYTLVTEFNGTPSNNTGKTEYAYRFTADYWNGTAASTGVPLTYDYFYKRGQLSRKTEFENLGGNNYQKVHEVDNTYTAFPETSYDVGFVAGIAKRTEGMYCAYPDQVCNSDDSDANAFPYTGYAIKSDDNYLTSTVVKNYSLSDPTKFTVDSTAYTYSNVTHQQPTFIAHVDSRGNQLNTFKTYPADYVQSGTSTGNYTLDLMLQVNMQAAPIESVQTYANAQTSVFGAVNAEYHAYTTSAGNAQAVLPLSVSSLKVGQSVSNFSNATIGSGGTIQTDGRYIKAINFDSYDNQNNLTGYTSRNATPVKILWDYSGSQPVAKFENMPATTTVGNVAYTSFETGNFGNWSGSGVPTSPGFVPTGKLAYPMSGGNITSPTLDSSQPYIVTYWSNSGAVNVSGIAGTALKSANGWTLYQHLIPSGTSQITLSGSGYIDELRLYPSGTQVTTYTYQPLVGVTSTTDPKNIISYYEYDNFQRLLNVKDKDGNIVKHNEYHYVNQ